MGPEDSNEPLTTDVDENAVSTPQLSPDQLQRLEYEVLRQQRLVLGATGGFIAALVGALIWAGITYASGYEIGWIAVGIGFLVGITVKVLGRGVTSTFGIVGGGMALLSVVLGKALAIVALVAFELQTDWLSVMTAVGPAGMLAIFQETFSPIDLLFYGIAIWEGFKLSVNDKAEMMAAVQQEEGVAT